MAKIKKLSVLEAKKIAAGEVVERPANIVKELVENSIDAGASLISVYIAEGGKKLIRVVDNGCGMSLEDAILSFEHHATSKITTVNDLDTLNTFGFRGEALSSISSVARVTLVTKDESSQAGSKLILQDGDFKQEETSCNVGTDITVEDLFFNVPARLKFLKKDETEYRQVLQLFQAYCFAYKDIHFKFYNNHNLIYNCPPVADEKQRIAQLWDYAISQNLFFVSQDSKNPEYKIWGNLTNYQSFQYNKNKIFIFVNRRFVKNIEISRAILKGYANVLPQGKFPAGLLFVEVPPTDLDVNIHPRKEEVKLLNSFKIESAIQKAISGALESNLSANILNTVKIDPAFVLPTESAAQLFSRPLSKSENAFDGSFMPASAAFNKFENNTIQSNAINFTREHVPSVSSFSTKEVQELFGSALIPEADFPIVTEQIPIDNFLVQYNYIGQLKKTYLMLEQEDGLLIVDQHAAHESVLYDIFLNKFDEVATVKLLFPQVVRLSQSDLLAISGYFDLLKKYGIEADVFGESELIIQATPVHIKSDYVEDLILQVVSWLSEFRNLQKEDFDALISKKICAQMACKAAVKAGDELTREQVSQLLTDLSKTSNRFKCPHGRPTMWNLDLYDIEKKFKRV